MTSLEIIRKDMGEEVYKAVIGRIQDISADDDCVDNWRAVRIGGSPDGLIAYANEQQSGCCGSCERIVTLQHPVQGYDIQFMVGYNYGH